MRRVHRCDSLSAVYRFALRPLWIVSHVAVGLLVVVMLGAGFWQLRRLDQRQERNSVIDERSQAEVEPLDAVLHTDPATADLSAIELSHVRVDGIFDRDAEVLVRNRTQDGVAGTWVVTPLDTGDGEGVLVNRGFVPAGTDPPAAPLGDRTLTGWVQLTQERGSIGPVDDPTGVLEVVSRVDVERIDRQTDLDLAPVWVQLEAPVTDELPVPLPPPDADDGPPHLSYAVQWFSFSAIALIGYPVVLRRIARRQRGSVPDWDLAVAEPPGRA